MSTVRSAGPAAEVAARPWILVGQAWAALAAAMGVGRFVYTPILPLMHEQAGLSRQAGADLATANYVGYLAGALIMIVVPALTRSAVALRASMLVLAASLALMPVSSAVPWWAELRCVAGVTSAFVFVAAAGALLAGLRGQRHHLVGWGFGGVGAGIALSGLLLLVLRQVGDWRQAWWCSTALVLAGTAACWRLPMPRAAAAGPAAPSGPGRTRRGFAVLAASYSLEGFGYIVAGTFLVAAIDQHAPGWVGTGAWVMVGVAAIPSAVLWAALARRWSRPALLVAALLLQLVGVLLPVGFGGAAAALVSAVLFGGTFLGIVLTALAIGNQVGTPRSVAILTTGYGVGQILGPLAVAPLLHAGYRPALALSAAVVAASALAACALLTSRQESGAGSGTASSSMNSVMPAARKKSRSGSGKTRGSHGTSATGTMRGLPIVRSSPPTSMPQRLLARTLRHQSAWDPKNNGTRNPVPSGLPRTGAT